MWSKHCRLFALFRQTMHGLEQGQSPQNAASAPLLAHSGARFALCTSIPILLMLSRLLTRRNLQQGETSDSGSHTSQRARGEQGR